MSATWVTDKTQREKEPREHVCEAAQLVSTQSTFQKAKSALLTVRNKPCWLCEAVIRRSRSGRDIWNQKRYCCIRFARQSSIMRFGFKYRPYSELRLSALSNRPRFHFSVFTHLISDCCIQELTPATVCLHLTARVIAAGRSFFLFASCLQMLKTLKQACRDDHLTV